jgi:hypothetical protein
MTIADDRTGAADETAARGPTRDPAHERPAGADDATVKAVGKLSEAYEWLIRARGELYTVHQHIGHLDFQFGEAADLLEEAGHHELAEGLRTELVGRNLLNGRWTFQIVEEFDRTYWDVATRWEQTVRDRLMDGRRHVYESELKDQRRTPGEPGHERRPGAPD